MNYSITIEPSFHYASLWIKWGIALILAGLLVWWIVRLGRAGKLRPVTDRIEAFFRNLILGKSRARAMKQLEAVQSDFDAGRIDLRLAHQGLSKAVRDFVREVTGIRTDAYTFVDIQKMGNKNLTKLVALLYVPEFAQTSSADFHQNIELSKELITKWE